MRPLFIHIQAERAVVVRADDGDTLIVLHPTGGTDISVAFSPADARATAVAMLALVGGPTPPPSHIVAERITQITGIPPTALDSLSGGVELLVRNLLILRGGEASIAQASGATADEAYAALWREITSLEPDGEAVLTAGGEGGGWRQWRWHDDRWLLLRGVG